MIATRGKSAKRRNFIVQGNTNVWRIIGKKKIILRVDKNGLKQASVTVLNHVSIQLQPTMLYPRQSCMVDIDRYSSNVLILVYRGSMLADGSQASH